MGDKTNTNSVGMRMVYIKPGTFTMGQDAGGDVDEKPAHLVTISRAFLMAETPVTNEQYEQYDALHKARRGSGPADGPIDESLGANASVGFSTDDAEAAVMVSWHEAQGFCNWLTEKEGRLYRLPTEAEWEFACRSGASTPFSTGNALPAACLRRQIPHNREFRYAPVSLRVGQTRANRFGVRDMHGLVEEWCHDWYAPYPKSPASTEERGIHNPSGPLNGFSDVWARVTRGGSHHTSVHDLRSASRMGAHPRTRSWFIGFRIVAGLPVVAGRTSSANWFPVPDYRSNVTQQSRDWVHRPFITDMRKPDFTGPTPFVIPPRDKSTPFFPHNHCPALTWCANGDLLACWFSTEDERGRGMVILASRLRAGIDRWDPASLFFDVPDRNPTGSSLWHDGAGRLLHVNSVTPAGTWSDCILTIRESTDNGASWSTPRLIGPEHTRWQRAVAGMVAVDTTGDDKAMLLQPCDAGGKYGGATRFLRSADDGANWDLLNADLTQTEFAEQGSGPLVAGVHGAVADRGDGTLIATGRDTEIDGRMPISVSDDGGETWRYSASPFLPIGSGQRSVLLRLREGPLLLISFTNRFREGRNGFGEYPEDGLEIRDSAGIDRRVFGLFAALSDDGGRTWPLRKLLTDNREPEYLETGDTAPNLKGFWMDSSRSEHSGYLAGTQTPDGTIHVISSHWYYRFNLQWVKTPLPPIARSMTKQQGEA